MTTARLTDAELQAIEQRRPLPMGEDVPRLLREVRALKAERDALKADLAARTAERDGLHTELTHETDRHGATIKQRNELELLLEESRRVERAALKMAESLDGERIAARAEAEALRRERDEARRLLADAQTAYANAETRADAALARAEAAERERDCYRAARVAWPEHVQAAIARGDVEACAADAKARHDNWTALRAEHDRLAADAARLRQLVERLRPIIRNAMPFNDDERDMQRDALLRIDEALASPPPDLAEHDAAVTEAALAKMLPVLGCDAAGEANWRRLLGLPVAAPTAPETRVLHEWRDGKCAKCGAGPGAPSLTYCGYATRRERKETT